MQYSVSHATTYEYSHPVFLEPHLIRLCPRCDPGQRLEKFELKVTPPPAGLSSGLDAENNPFHLVWFSDLTDRFHLESSYLVETLKANPFASFLTCGDKLPLVLTKAERKVLEPCLSRTIHREPGDGKTVDTLTRIVQSISDETVLNFLTELNNYLFEQIEKITRLDHGLQPISKTIDTRRGACRDTALVFMAVCRNVGIPARFVSGCQEGDPDKPEGELHAWVEVYLPGFGWQGYDPTHGLAVADRHIAYAASPLPEHTAPVSGTFRGTGAISQMHTQVKIRVGESASEQRR